MKKSKVEKAINSELDYISEQVKQGKSHVVEDFPLASALVAIEHNLNLAKKEWYAEKDPYPKSMNLVRKISGICFNMGLKYGMPEREVKIEVIESKDSSTPKGFLFRTEDGVDMFEGDDLLFISRNHLNLLLDKKPSEYIMKWTNAKAGGYEPKSEIYFSNFKEAEKYVLLNKTNIIKLKDLNKLKKSKKKVYFSIKELIDLSN